MSPQEHIEEAEILLERARPRDPITEAAEIQALAALANAHAQVATAMLVVTSEDIEVLINTITING